MRRLIRRLRRTWTPASMPPLDLRGTDPMEALAYAGRRSVLVEVPLARCRGLFPMAFPCTRDAAHPFVLTTEACLEAAEIGFAGSPLQAYFQSVQPRSAAELLGIADVESTLHRLAPAMAEVPWRGLSGPAVQERRARAMRDDASGNGVPLNGTDGWHAIGPVSQEKGELEIRRLVRVLRSVRQHGYAPDEVRGWIRGQLMVREDGGWRVYLAGDGQHRAAVLTALGYSWVTVRLRADSTAVLRGEAARWPGVRAGGLARGQALAVFDRIYAGQQPPALARLWPPAAGSSPRSKWAR